MKGKFPLQGHFKTKAKISIWLLHSAPSCENQVKLEGSFLLLPSLVWLLLVLTWVKYRQPATQIGGLWSWYLVKFTCLLFQSKTFFLFLFLFNFTSLKWDTSSHAAPSASAASLGHPWRERHKVTSPEAFWHSLWQWQNGESWAPNGQHWAGAAKATSLSLPHTGPLSHSSTSKWFHHPYTSHSHPAMRGAEIFLNGHVGNRPSSEGTRVLWLL